MKIKISFIVFLFVFSKAFAGDGKLNKFEDCNYSVFLNDEYIVKQQPTVENRCELVINSKKTASDISISLAAEFLFEAYRLGFDFHNGKWLISGRQSSSEDAEIIDIGEWTGLLGETTFGVHDAAGFKGTKAIWVALLREIEVLDGINVKIEAENISKTELRELISKIAVNI